MAAELESTKLNPDSHLGLVSLQQRSLLASSYAYRFSQDAPLLKVPHELHKINLLSARRTVERERDQVLSSLKSLSSNLTSPSQDASQLQQQALTALDSMLIRLDTLKRKLSVIHDEEQSLHRQSRARIDHLQALHDIPSLADVKYDEWAKVRLNRLLVDYMLRCGYGDSAKALAHENKVSDLVDMEAFMLCHRVAHSLSQGRTKECLDWCNDNNKTLKKNNSDLEHELRLQQYIELVRTKKHKEAVKHARKYLTSHPVHAFGIHAAGLLAQQPNTPIEPYKTLYSHDRWRMLAEHFIATFQSLLSLPKQPPLYHALSAGLSVLKTPACHSSQISSSSNANTASGTSVCPICSTELNELARRVPYAHHTKSTVETDPVVLPNGRVYGRERLMKWQGKAAGGTGVGNIGGRDALGEGLIRDPTRPDEVFEVEKLRKIYIT